ncbi:hypothetical protein C7S18_22330 [Ahniella affigens]|uniref:Uncharacterized protein n=1 Tax=Ahniella affigens TaxID=2021234 RepID=A0A2P1PY17_9GAMM|nr:hypothetical protein C7S18_22330 [Ahniella affigens]
MALAKVDRCDVTPTNLVARMSTGIALSVAPTCRRDSLQRESSDPSKQPGALWITPERAAILW